MSELNDIGEAGLRVTEQDMLDELRAVDLAEGLRDKPINVVDIDIRGLDKTKPHIVEREAELLKHCSTFEELQNGLEEVWEHLTELNTFKAVALSVEDRGSEGTCDVQVRVHEKGAPFLAIGAHAQGLHGGLDINGGLHNILGHAERVTVALQSDEGFGKNGTRQYEASLKLSKPRIQGTGGLVNLELAGTSFDRSKASSYVQHQAGVLGCLSWGTVDQFQLSYGLHQQLLRPAQAGGGQIQAILAAVGAATPANGSASRWQASHAVTQQMGESLKSAVGLTWSRDVFDPANPNTNFSIRSNSEVAGLWPGAKVLRYARQQLAFSGSWSPSLQSPFSLCSSLNLGLLRPWPNTAGPTFLPSRFPLGGMITGMRGFDENSIGGFHARPVTTRQASHPGEDYLGGDFLAVGTISAKLHLSAFSERLRGVPAFVHVFGTLGKNVLLPETPLKDQLQNLRTETALRNLNHSYGIGLEVPFSVAKLELGVAATNKTQQAWPNRFYWGFSVGL